MAVNRITNSLFQWNDLLFGMARLTFLPNSLPMSNINTRTDSTAQFTQSNFPGYEHVHIIPFDLQDTACLEEKSLVDGVLIQRRLVLPLSAAIHPFLHPAKPCIRLDPRAHTLLAA
jgi:hypothetical protein